MSGLFDNLAARFMPDARPTIRPRPQSRFEGERSGDGIEEQTGERIARAPQAAPKTQRTPAPRPEPVATEAAHESTAPIDSQRQTPIQSAAPELTTKDIPASRPENVAAEATLPEETITAKQIDAAPTVAPMPRPPAVSSAQETARTAEPSAPVETITERVITTVQRAPDPDPVLRTAQTPTEATAEHGLQQTETSRESPVIRIGRIEVTRPAAEPPAAPPSAAVRPEPPRRTASASRTRQASGLTDYLGWKKR